jgi:UDP-N-acetylglucosamine--N-acetylmuramyl-(pentapeptide) pyrophosphoryl-undecaprenol N-acetylglucosamine transferase
MRVALTAGGTGGHIIPAFAVLDALQVIAGEALEVAFFGPENRGERQIVEARGLRFVSVPSAAVRGRGPLGLAKSAWRLLAGIATAVRRLRTFKPDAVFSTGGYASFPTSVAARVLRKPLVVFLPDVTPGWAVRAEQRLATKMATTTEAALEHLPRKKTTVTGYPVRASFDIARDAAREQLGIDTGAKVLVVAGASQGAQAINRAVFAQMTAMAPATHIFHITGAADVAEAQKLTATATAYAPAAFRDDLPVLLRAADLAVMRAGASVLGEIPAAGVPAILVPGTFAGGHQRDNAKWLADAGAAVALEERDLERLGSLVSELLGDSARLAAMRSAAEKLHRPDAADAIAKLVMEVAAR